MISYNTVNVKMPAIRRRDTSAWVKAVAASYGKKVGEIAYIFVDDEEILRVNREYLQHDYYTDIITFDYTEGDTIALRLSSEETLEVSPGVQQTFRKEEIRKVTSLAR